LRYTCFSHETHFACFFKKKTRKIAVKIFVALFIFFVKVFYRFLKDFR